MGRVEAFSLGALIMWFFSEDHAPPHFHVKKAGEWEIKISILETTEDVLSFEIKWGSGPNGRLQAQLAKRVVDNRDALYKEWSRKTGAEK
ncbi:MAG: DUF4160 domain-containing protein [Coriobacteriia bacterium]